MLILLICSPLIEISVRIPSFMMHFTSPWGTRALTTSQCAARRPLSPSAPGRDGAAPGKQTPPPPPPPGPQVSRGINGGPPGTADCVDVDRFPSSNSQRDRAVHPAPLVLDTCCLCNISLLLHSRSLYCTCLRLL